MTSSTSTAGDVERMAWGGHDASLTSNTSPVDVEWDGTKRVRVRLLDAMRTHKPLVVHGPRGVGKTFAIARAAEFYRNNANEQCQVAYLRIPAADRGRGLYQAILAQLAIPAPAKGATETELLFELSETITERERILVVDESHRLSTRNMDAIQNLVDVPATRATFVLVGSPDTKNRLSPELWSRAEAKVEFRRLDDNTCVSVLREMHPIFANTDEALLRRLNRTAAKGELRYWAALLGRALKYAGTVGDRIEADHVQLLTADR